MRRSITFNLNTNGIYVLDQDGASGKSYLRKLMYENRFNNPEYMTMTYSEDMDIDSTVEKILEFNGEFIMMDRVDLYADDKLLNAIVNKNAKVLVDLKDPMVWNNVDYKFASIKVTEDSIIVEEV